MTIDAHDNPQDHVPTKELHHELERVLAPHYQEPVRIRRLERQPWAYRSSFALESLTLDLGQPGPLRIMFKDLTWHRLTPEARLAKQSASYDPLREITVYEQILSRHPGYAPKFFGAAVDPGRDRFWLFIEHIDGQELYQIADFSVWKQVARRLAGMHVALRPSVERTSRSQNRWLNHGPQEQQRWFEQACDSITRKRGEAIGRELRRLADLLPSMAVALAARRPTLLHGEFYPSNIFVQCRSDSWSVSAVDWEMAGRGTGLLDLAALIVGRWSDEQWRALAREYYVGMANFGDVWPEDKFFETLEFCRLYTALRWIGWSDDWSPPSEHAHDWLEEAIASARRLG